LFDNLNPFFILLFFLSLREDYSSRQKKFPAGTKQGFFKKYKPSAARSGDFLKNLKGLTLLRAESRELPLP